jgi:hypothetical protein
MDIIGTLSAIKTATEIAKGIKDAKDSYDQAETRFKMAEIINALADAKINLADIKTELSEKERVIRDLQEQLNEKQKLVFHGEKYFAENDPIPFCATCYETKGLLVHLRYIKKTTWQGGIVPERYACPDCKYCTENMYKPN